MLFSEPEWMLRRKEKNKHIIRLVFFCKNNFNDVDTNSLRALKIFRKWARKMLLIVNFFHHLLFYYVFIFVYLGHILYVEFYYVSLQCFLIAMLQFFLLSVQKPDSNSKTSSSNVRKWVFILVLCCGKKTRRDKQP